MKRLAATLAAFATTTAHAQLIPAEATVEPASETVSASAALPLIAAMQPNLIADLAAAVSPAVVNIRVTTAQGEVVSEGHGSGFVISPVGEVVTNHHVIDEGENIEVEFNNGVSFTAQIVGTDPETDIALLQIDSDQTFPTVKWNKADAPRIGQFVVPIGNPFGIGQSVSFGIISAIGRERVDSGAYVDYIQTDATVNTGNSGGPLFNLSGEVVGVNSAIYSPTGASVGIAFAIPHSTAESVIARLRNDGEVRRGYLGVNLRTAEYSDGRSGATVDSVVPGSPAQMGGLQLNDIILSVNGIRVRNGTEATRKIGELAPGDTAKFRIERDEAEYDVTARLVRRPSKEVLERRAAGLPDITTTPGQPQQESLPARPNLNSVPFVSLGNTGLSVVDLSSQFREAIGMGYDEVGVYVESVLAGTPAEQNGIERGMILMEVEMEAVPSVEHFKYLLGKAKADRKSSVLVKVRRKNGQQSYVSLDVL